MGEQRKKHGRLNVVPAVNQKIDKLRLVSTLLWICLGGGSVSDPFLSVESVWEGEARPLVPAVTVLPQSRGYDLKIYYWGQPLTRAESPRNPPPRDQAHDRYRPAHPAAE